MPAKTNSYDANGNLLSDGTTTYTYTLRNRMYSALVGGVTVTQMFNGFGQRMQRSNSGGMFVYDEQGHLIGEYDTTTGNMTRETVYLGDLPVTVLNQTVTGTAPAKVTTTNVYNIYPDHIGTPRLITRATDGKIVWRWDNGDPFGLIQPNQNPGGVGTFTFNLRMPGQYYDRDTNLFYNYYRDYDPQLGRYVQSDPIGLGGGINTYGYVDGNPLIKFDPSGLAGCRMIGLIMECDFRPSPGFVDPFMPSFPNSKSASDGSSSCPPLVDKAGGKVSPVAQNMDPPGNCSHQDQERMQRDVNNSCKRPRSCKPGMNGAEKYLMREVLAKLVVRGDLIA